MSEKKKIIQLSVQWMGDSRRYIVVLNNPIFRIVRYNNIFGYLKGYVTTPFVKSAPGKAFSSVGPGPGPITSSTPGR